MVASAIRTQLELARKELLELGLRNTLLNYRLTKARGAEISDATSIDVLNWLVSEGMDLTFLPAEVVAQRRDGKSRSPALPTSHEEKTLQSRLLATYYAAKTHVEERGVNILYVALGMLHWYEDDSSSRELKAPLLLIPVELERTSASEKFTVRWDQEDVEDNLSLAAKLKGEFGINLPEMPDVEELDLGRYFDAVEHEFVGRSDGVSIATRSRWASSRSRSSSCTRISSRGIGAIRTTLTPIH